MLAAVVMLMSAACAPVDERPAQSGGEDTGPASATDGVQTGKAVDRADYAAYKIKYLDPVTVGSGIGNLSWSDAGEIGARFYLDFYQYMSQSDPEAKYTRFEEPSGVEYAVPADVVEGIVMRYFDGLTSEYLQTMFQYDGQRQCYLSQFNSSGPEEIATVTDIKEDGDTIVIAYATRYSDPSFEGGSYELGIKKQDDGGFVYAYCKVLSGPAFPASGIGADQSAAYPRLLYYHEGGEHRIENLGDAYAGVEVPSSYKDLKVKALTAYDALFVDPAAAGVLQEAWVRIQLEQGFRVFIGYEDRNDLRKLAWLSADGNPSAQGPGKQAGALFAELALAEGKDGQLIKTNGFTLPLPDSTSSLKKTYLYSVNSIAEGQNPSGSTPYKAVYDAAKRISDEELTFKGVKLFMSLDEVLKTVGGYDEDFANSDTMRSYVKDQMRYVFDWRDGKYCLIAMMLDDNRYTGDEFIRGVHIGDSMESVLAKLPGNDKTPKKWAEQFIYGSRDSDTYAYLAYDGIYSDWYNFYIKTESAFVHMLFGRDRTLMNASVGY